MPDPVTPSPADQPRRRGATVGTAVDLPAHIQQPAAEEEAKQVTPAEKPDPRWGPQPVFKDQYSHEQAAELGLFREGPRFTRVYNLLESAELNAWNAELEKLHPESSPSQILIEDPKTYELGAKLILVANFQVIEYNQIVPPEVITPPKP